MLTPSSNTVLEPVTMRMLAQLNTEVSVHFSRIRVTSISPEAESRRQFDLEPLLAAAQLLADAKVDVIVWNGTSGGWEGLDADREMVRAIESATSIPATTGTLATIDAFAELGVHRYGLVVPYVDEITTAIKGTFATAGFDCAAWANEGVSVNWEFSQITPEVIADRARTVARSRPDGIAIFCTNLCGAPVVDTLERELQIPIVDSVVVCLWAAFGVLGRKLEVSGYGRLAAGGYARGAKL
jgi:maleate isomerase